MKNDKKFPQSNIPVLPMRNALVFPGQTIAVLVGRSRSILALQKAQKNGGWILTVGQKTELKDKEPGIVDLYRMGTLSKIDQVKGTEKKGYQIIVSGVARFGINTFDDNKE